MSLNAIYDWLSNSQWMLNLVLRAKTSECVHIYDNSISCYGRERLGNNSSLQDGDDTLGIYTWILKVEDPPQ